MKMWFSFILALTIGSLMGCTNDKDTTIQIATDGLKEAIGQKFEYFSPERTEIEKDNSNFTRFKVYGTVRYQGVLIKEAYSVAQHNKNTKDPEWAWGGCNCFAIYEAFDDGNFVAK